MRVCVRDRASIGLNSVESSRSLGPTSLTDGRDVLPGQAAKKGTVKAREKINHPKTLGCRRAAAVGSEQQLGRGSKRFHMSAR